VLENIIANINSTNWNYWINWNYQKRN